MSREDALFVKTSARKSNLNSKGETSPLRTSLAFSSVYDGGVQLPKYDTDGNQIPRLGSLASNLE